MRTHDTMPLDRRSLLALMAATAATAATGDVSAQAQGARKVLRISAPYNPSTLDPHTARSQDIFAKLASATGKLRGDGDDKDWCLVIRTEPRDRHRVQSL